MTIRMIIIFIYLSIIATAIQADFVEETKTVSATELAADVQEWRSWLFATHPEPAFSMNVASVEAEFDDIAQSLEGDYGPRKAWWALAVMNPIFNDGHVAIRAPAAAYEAYLEAGGAPFGVPVKLEDGLLHVADTFNSGDNLEGGETILAINGHDASEITRSLLARIHGDSEGLRIHLLEARFAQYLWLATGGAEQWTLTIAADDTKQRTIILDRSTKGSTSESDPWKLDFIENTAVLTVNTFDAELKQAFAEYLVTAFANIAKKGAEQLIIDISANGGGAHELSDQLMAYITTKRYTPLSAVTARITPENQARIPNAEIGQVMSLPFEQWVEPPAELENRFKGEVAVMVGAGTYSQAIVMAATVQDFDIAPVAGLHTEGRANSTGQVQIHRLTHSGLEVGAPIYLFFRASGDKSSMPIEPDIPLTGTRQEQIRQLKSILENR